MPVNSIFLRIVFIATNATSKVNMPMIRPLCLNNAHPRITSPNEMQNTELTFLPVDSDKTKSKTLRGDADENLSRIITIRRWRCTREKKS